MTEGGHNIEYGNKPKEHSGISYGKFNHASKRESHAESLNSGHMDDRPRMEQYLGFTPYESSRTHIAASCSTYPKSHPLAPPLEVPKNSFNCPNLYQPYEKCGQPLDSSVSGIISVTRSSPTVVIRPPPAGNSSLPQNSVACKTADLNDIAIVHSKESDGCYPSNLKYLNSEGRGDPFSTSQSEFCRQGNDQISLASSSVEELSSPLLSKDTLDNSVKARCVSNLPDLNVLDRFAVATNGAQGVNSTQNFSDCIDHQNPAVDSPCWKGAPASHFLPFDDVDAGKSNHSKEKLDECYGFDHEEHQTLLSFNDSVTTASQKPCERSKHNNNGCAREGMPLSSKTAPYANCPAREQS
ncbi:uncharacterized protein Fot_03609 [Forsythia ovata]|uniref:Uncharacterized protein n=1 Tax=Forsythia ovata TaxID=205694 RepID=A0ABD1XA62_9LAMI